MFIAHMGPSFYNLFTEHRNLLSSHLHWISKEMMGEEAFQLSVATPNYARSMSLHKAIQEKSLMSSFPADVQMGLLYLLVLHRIFSPCWYFTGASFPVDASQISYFKFAHANQTKRPLVKKQPSEEMANPPTKLSFLNLVNFNQISSKYWNGAK